MIFGCKNDGLENNSPHGAVSATSLDVGSWSQREDKGPEKMNCPTPIISINQNNLGHCLHEGYCALPRLKGQVQKVGPWVCRFPNSARWF